MSSHDVDVGMDFNKISLHMAFGPYMNITFDFPSQEPQPITTIFHFFVGGKEWLRPIEENKPRTTIVLGSF